MSTVRLGSWVANGGVGQHGFSVSRTGLVGWFDNDGYQIDETARPQAAGSFDTPVFAPSRRVTISGLCHATSAQELAWFQHQLSGLLADGSTGRLVVDLDGSELWGDVRRVGSRWERLVPGSLARYQLQLWMPNPRKFGDLNLFGDMEGGYTGVNNTIVAAQQYGNFPADPVFVVRGNMTDYTIWGPDGVSRIRVVVPVVDGHPHTFDTATGLLTVDGQVVTGAVSHADPWTVDPGVPTNHELSTTAGWGVLQVRVRDTYV